QATAEARLCTTAASDRSSRPIAPHGARRTHQGAVKPPGGHVSHVNGLPGPRARNERPGREAAASRQSLNRLRGAKTAPASQQSLNRPRGGQHSLEAVEAALDLFALGAEAQAHEARQP